MSHLEASVDGNTISPERRLFQTVVLASVLDATNDKPNMGTQAQLEKWKADNWIRFNSRDYREVCELAGIDPDFLRDRYLSGGIKRDVLVAAWTKRRGMQEQA